MDNALAAVRASQTAETWPPSVYIVHAFAASAERSLTDISIELVNKLTTKNVKSCTQSFVEQVTLTTPGEADQIVENLLNLQSVDAQNSGCILADALYGLVATSRSHFRGAALRQPLQQQFLALFCSAPEGRKQTMRMLGRLYGKLIHSRTLNGVAMPWQERPNLTNLMFVWGVSEYAPGAFKADAVIRSTVEKLMVDKQSRVTPVGAVSCNIADIWTKCV